MSTIDILCLQSEDQGSRTYASYRINGNAITRYSDFSVTAAQGEWEWPVPYMIGLADEIIFLTPTEDESVAMVTVSETDATSRIMYQNRNDDHYYSPWILGHYIFPDGRIYFNIMDQRNEGNVFAHLMITPDGVVHTYSDESFGWDSTDAHKVLSLGPDQTIFYIISIYNVGIHPVEWRDGEWVELGQAINSGLWGEFNGYPYEGSDFVRVVDNKLYFGFSLYDYDTGNSRSGWVVRDLPQ